jgi:microcompartment protein CcmK/EutM
MVFAMVVGTVVCSSRKDGTDGARYLLVERTDSRGRRKGDHLVALDAVGAGHEELVLVSEGSPARETPSTVNRPFDALIVGIIDLVDGQEGILYKK